MAKVFTPYPYQEKGIEWVLERPASCLFWGMGMGKTPTTLIALDTLMALGESKKVLVIAPLRVAQDTWVKESKKWSNLEHFTISKVLGSAKERTAALFQDADIYVINRENVPWLCQFYEKGGWPFDTVVIDELSSFKSASSVRFKELRKYRGRIKRIIGLTGTPASNGLIDLWSQMYLIDKGERLGKTITSYRSQYFYPGQGRGHVVYNYVLKDGAEESIYKKLGDICMSLKKEDMLDLPGQMYQTIDLALPDDLMSKYRQFERDLVMDALDDEGEITASNAAVLTGKLLQFCNGAIYDDEKIVHEIHPVKLDALEELIEEANGQPVLVFYTFRHDRDRIKKRIPIARDLSTTEDISDWNDKQIPVAIAHPASVGHGLNLQEGGHIIIWYGLPWSLELYQQANERLNRPGQTEVCQVYHLIVKNTHDERVMKALASKDLTQKSLIDALKLDITEEDI